MSWKLLQLVCVFLILIAPSCAWQKEESEHSEHHEESGHADSDQHLDDAGWLQLDTAAMDQAGIQIESVQRAAVQDTIAATGVVRPDESRLGHIRPLSEGIVRQVFVQRGARVRKGHPLVSYDNIEVGDQLERFPGVVSSFSQPIKFRMMELIEGVGARSDVVIKIFGDDTDVLLDQANRIAGVIGRVPGAEDVKVQQVTGLPLLQIQVRRDQIARYGMNVSDVQEIVQSAIAGTKATTVLEGFMRFDAVVRFRPESRDSVEDMGNLLVSGLNGDKIPLGQLAGIESMQGPAEISRENGRRRISVEVNVPRRDIGSFVAEAQREVERQVPIPPGYVVEWGGMFEHLESGRNRLMVAVPATFFLIFLLLFTTFNSVKQAAMVFTGIPFAVSGGVLVLLARDMHFSMSAGIGFIAVSGVAVLNGVVLVTFINQLRERGRTVLTAVYRGSLGRLRPVLMTALVASLGFVPMALSTGTGAEVQRPLATVVIGGLMTSTLLTLFVLPILYHMVHRAETIRRGPEEALPAEAARDSDDGFNRDV